MPQGLFAFWRAVNSLISFHLIFGLISFYFIVSKCFFLLPFKEQKRQIAGPEIQPDYMLEEVK